MNESLPTPVRRRLALGRAAAVVATVAALAACAVGAYVSLWTQARAEWLAVSEPQVSARYLGWESEDDPDGAGISFSLDDHEYVRLDSGRTVELWHPESPVSDLYPDTGEDVAVVVFPGEDRAFLADELPGSDYEPWWRVADWFLWLQFDVRLFLTVVFGIAYGVVRLVLGFSPLALPSLIRRREGADAVLVDYARSEREGQIVVTAATGDDTYRWSARVASDAPPRLGDPLRVVGHVREGGWVIAWTDEARLLPTGPLHGTDAEVVRP